ncbi:MAG: hypothetical protein E7374_01935 [Clostridiales bacterium]|nr:hypothetical protein [Clostridiales bacterium]
MIEQFFKKSNSEFENDKIKDDSIEKESYSESSYKHVKKIRERGTLMGYKVPYLQYPVQKQEKPRPLFLALAIVSAVLFGLACAFAIYAFVTMILPMAYSALGIETPKWIVLDIYGILPTIGTSIKIFLWLIIIMLAALMCVPALILGMITKKLFSWTKLSMQEVAEGYEIKNLIFNLGLWIILLIGLGIVACFMFKGIKPIGIVAIFVVIAAIDAVLGTLLGLLVHARNKERKKFNELPIEQQEDFKRHTKALDRASRTKRRNAFSSKTDSWSGVDF